MTVQFVSPVDRSELRQVDAALIDGSGRRFTVVGDVAQLVHPDQLEAADAFSKAYGAVRRAEGRTSLSRDYYRALPYRDLTGNFPDQWEARARTYDLVRAHLADGPRRILDAGAGNCWLAARLSADGHEVAATDLNDDTDDGLGAHIHYDQRFPVARAAMDALPLADSSVDTVIYNASAHYADLGRLLSEAQRVLQPDGEVLIADSPVYRDAAAGEQMVAEMAAYIRTLGVEPAPHAGPGYLTQTALDTAGVDWRQLDHTTIAGRLRRRVAGWKAHREAATLPLLLGRFS